MTYDYSQDRWTVDLGARRYGLHCGECFSVLLGDTGIPCRLEYADRWYVIMPGARFDLRIHDSYKVEF